MDSVKGMVVMTTLLYLFSAGLKISNAKDFEAVLQQKIASIQAIANHSVVVAAAERQNSESLSTEDIERRDQAWKTNGMTPFKSHLMESIVGRYLQAKVESNKLAYSEAFLTDARGVNVTCFPATTDYWQGDEEKFTHAFNNGQGAIYIGPLELDESTATHAVQIGVPVMNNEGRAIGVLVMGVRLSYAEYQWAKVD